jgi:hypothetical protein
VSRVHIFELFASESTKIKILFASIRESTSKIVALIRFNSFKIFTSKQSGSKKEVASIHVRIFTSNRPCPCFVTYIFNLSSLGIILFRYIWFISRDPWTFLDRRIKRPPLHRCNRQPLLYTYISRHQLSFCYLRFASYFFRYIRFFSYSARFYSHHFIFVPPVKFSNLH